MKALLLAAGLGTRLRPLTDAIPKCLIPVRGRPLLEHWLALLYHADVYPILINTYHFADSVKNYIYNSKFNEIVKLTYEDNLLGTAGTLLENRDFLTNEPFMLIHADNLSIFDVKAYIERHKQRPADCEITMMTFITPTPESCGIVEMDEDGVVKAFHEKIKNPPGRLANGAVYILEPSIIDFLESLGKRIIDFSTEVLPHYIGRIFTFHNNIYHRDIGTIESYNAALKEFDALCASDLCKEQLWE